MRERVPGDQITTFSELLTKNRLEEDTFVDCITTDESNSHMTVKMSDIPRMNVESFLIKKNHFKVNPSVKIG